MELPETRADWLLALWTFRAPSRSYSLHQNHHSPTYNTNLHLVSTELDATSSTLPACNPYNTKGQHGPETTSASSSQTATTKPTSNS
jgi:hypothetical protein